MNFDFLNNKRVTVMGLGIAGRGPGIVSFLLRHGAQVIVTDIKSRRLLRHTLERIPYKDVKFIFGRHRKQDFISADFILKNPAVPWDSVWLNHARKAGVPIITDVGLFFLGLPAGIRVVGITGTKGKTTTARLIWEILRRQFRTHLVGVPGTSYLGVIGRIRKGDIVIAELSSFDLEGLGAVGKSPDIAVITNISRDHLDRYTDLRAYIDTKTNIFRFQDHDGIAVLNGEQLLMHRIADLAPADVRFFHSDKVKTIMKYGIGGSHERQNIAAAITVARILGVRESVIQDALRAFRPSPGHIEYIGKRHNTIFINDTCATNPFATRMALRAVRAYYPGYDILLIIGGADKNLDFRILRSELQNVKKIAVLAGSASKKIFASLAHSIAARMHSVNSIRQALEWLCPTTGSEKDHPSVVLFSPAAASFGMFQNEFDRGRQFSMLVRRLITDRTA